MAEDTDPPLAVYSTDNREYDRVGRMYRNIGTPLPDTYKNLATLKPNLVLPKDYRSPEVLKQLLRDEVLVPSVTNIIDQRGKPYLLKWTAEQVAAEAVKTAMNHPGLIESKPGRARAYLEKTADRFRDFWGDQGHNVHEAMEALGLGRDISHMKLTEYEAACVEAWRQFFDTFQPEFVHTEITGFGHTTNRLGFAGTIDAIMLINGKYVIADYKCVTPDTLILLPTGATCRADELVTGQLIVAWDKDRGLHVAPVTHINDNGAHPTVRITTATGNVLHCTLNHPILATRDGRNFGFAKAEQLRVEDRVYLALGWNHNPARVETTWNRHERLSPYMYGILWSLAQFGGTAWTEASVIRLPGSSRDTLREELANAGFTFTEENELVVGSGLAAVIESIKKKAEDPDPLTVTELLALVNEPTIAEDLLGAKVNQIQGFFFGVQEVFSNKYMDDANFRAVYATETSARSLQQAYLNAGYMVTYGFGRIAHFVTIPHTTREATSIHGKELVEITDIEYIDEPTSTLAIEVDGPDPRVGSHTHITGGIISHNTNRSGLHIDVALQLAAGQRFEYITQDNETLTPMPHIDTAVAIHLAPKGFEVRRANTSDRIFDYFTDLRDLWGFQAFEGAYDPQAALLEKLTDPSQI